MDDQQNWIKEVSPKTEAEWKRQASSMTFQKPDKSSIERHEKKGLGPIDMAKCHDGEHPSDVHLRDLCAWNSASDLQIGHYLTTHILNEFKPLKRLPRAFFKQTTNISEAADEVSRSHLKNRKNWKPYRRDIRDNKKTRLPLGQAPDLGEFTSTRDYQLSIEHRGAKQDSGPSGGPSTATGSRRPVQNEEPPEMTAISKMSSHTSGSSHTRSRAGDDMDIDSPMSGSNASLHKALTRESVESAAHPMDAPKTQGEGIVKQASVEFLRTVTRPCPSVNLEWSAYEFPFRHQLGEALITAITDGCLLADDMDNAHCILEVKPFVIRAKPQKTIMQVGLEMLAFIVDCEKKGISKERYFMLSQFRHEVFITVAKPDKEYLEYLLDDRNVHLKTPKFLKLTHFGPFDLFDAKSVFSLGRMVLAIAVQINMDLSSGGNPGDGEQAGNPGVDNNN